MPCNGFRTILTCNQATSLITFAKAGWGVGVGAASSPIVYGSATPFVRVSEERGWSEGGGGKQWFHTGQELQRRRERERELKRKVASKRTGLPLGSFVFFSPSSSLRLLSYHLSIFLQQGEEMYAGELKEREEGLLF
ncbi:hypothetical protein CDAR_185171 [Caerostris darwini]|uniref:Uncharacterized protein n=1 Tax=Caerostris darwini TaxID=1538125 RepID=A0AAV4SMS6_9ARAC|nr:hypothetical protein CDAR_185171 [Caerostris darwini]